MHIPWYKIVVVLCLLGVMTGIILLLVGYQSTDGKRKRVALMLHGGLLEFFSLIGLFVAIGYYYSKRRWNNSA